MTGAYALPTKKSCPGGAASTRETPLCSIVSLPSASSTLSSTVDWRDVDPQIANRRGIPSAVSVRLEARGTEVVRSVKEKVVRTSEDPSAFVTRIERSMPIGCSNL